MSIGFLFWLLMILWAVFGFFWWRGATWAPWGGGALAFVLFLLLGLHDFGWPIHQ